MVAAGAMAVAGNTTDNSDLQGRFGSVPDFDEIKEIDPDVLGGWSAGDCELTNCDLLEAIEDTQELIGISSGTIRADIQNLSDDQSAQLTVTSETLRADHQDIMDEIGNIDYLDRDVFWDFVDGSDGTSWTIQELADHITNACE